MSYLSLREGRSLTAEELAGAQQLGIDIVSSENPDRSSVPHRSAQSDIMPSYIAIV
jgi:hypothetical protein